MWAQSHATSQLARLTFSWSSLFSEELWVHQECWSASLARFTDQSGWLWCPGQGSRSSAGCQKVPMSLPFTPSGEGKHHPGH